MQNQQSEEKPVLTVEETAALLGLHHSTLRLAIRAGRFPHIKVGRRILIPRAALDKLLDFKIGGACG